MHISQFMEKNFKHFNSRVTLDAAKAYKTHMEKGGKMMVTLAGAMSTAQLGISLAKMIRENKVHIICCTGANLEEDLFHLIACDRYKTIPNYRTLTAEQEEELFNQGYNRVTDVGLPEGETMAMMGEIMTPIWKDNDQNNKPAFPYENLYRLFREGTVQPLLKKGLETSWLYAAYEKNIPVIVPGWADSSTGNAFAALCYDGTIKNPNSVKSDTEHMLFLIKWYLENSKNASIGFFQIGGGIAGDFPICVVPTLRQEMQTNAPLWGYFSQISDSTTSYGSYSGAEPTEKITWAKLAKETPMFVIESDATIVAPLIFSYVLGE